MIFPFDKGFWYIAVDTLCLAGVALAFFYGMTESRIFRGLYISIILMLIGLFALVGV